MTKPPAFRGRPRRPPRRLPAALLAAWLVLALVVAQLAGLQHRIEHPRGPGWPASPAVIGAAAHAHGHTADEPTAAEAPGAAHDCAAYDAATLGDGPPQGLASSSTAAATVQVACPRHGRPGSAPQLGFRSRAPPRA